MKKQKNSNTGCSYVNCLLLQQVIRIDLMKQTLVDRILGESFIVDEEEYEKYCVRRRERDPCNDIDRFGHPNRMGWFLFPNLNEARLKKTSRLTFAFQLLCG